LLSLAQAAWTPLALPLALDHQGEDGDLVGDEELNIRSLVAHQYGQNDRYKSQRQLHCRASCHHLECAADLP